MGLDELPRKGKKVPELNEDSVRELSLYTYRILYEIMPDGVALLAVIHRRRDLLATEVHREI